MIGNMRHILILIIFMGAFAFTVKAQQADTLNTKSKSDSIYRKKDSEESKRFVPKTNRVKEYHPDSTHSPRKAWTRSAILPGLGQVYNHHWWKVPAIYVGLYMLTDAIITNQRHYKDFLAIAKFQQLGVSADDQMYANDPRVNLYKTYGGFTQTAIIDAKDNFYRNKELSILGFVVVWGVNVVDAYIYGKLQHSFSMDNNFNVKIQAITLPQSPVYASNFNTNFTPALKITLTLK